MGWYGMISWHLDHFETVSKGYYLKGILINETGLIN